MKILVTGFEPFGGEMTNPSYEAVKLLPDEIKGATIIKKEIPVVFGKCGDILESAIIEHSPDAVLCIGQAGGISAIAVERVGINLNEASIADNEGAQPIDKRIKEDGENAYFSTVPTKAMVSNIKDNDIAARVSYSAGTYVCNDILYQLLYMCNKKYPTIKGGFIHVPYSVEQAEKKDKKVPCMAIEKIAKGLEFAIEAIVLNESDRSDISMGTIM